VMRRSVRGGILSVLCSVCGGPWLPSIYLLGSNKIDVRLPFLFGGVVLLEGVVERTRHLSPGGINLFRAGSLCIRQGRVSHIK
jgi:hypothetical protein